MSRFIFTCGDINGIGPEIILKALNKLTGKSNHHFIVIIPQNIFEKTASEIEPRFSFKAEKSISKLTEQVTLLNTGKIKSEPGVPTKSSGKAAFAAIQLSCKLLKEKKADAVITAPVSKLALHKAGINFHGHTEIYADYFNSKKFMMMFLSDNFNAALATIHIPVKEIAKKITKNLLKEKIEISVSTLKNDLNINNPKIALLGLNPHAGENGYIGKEEEKVIKPLLKFYEGKVEGPFSPDAFFANKYYKNFDLTLGMYHDQVLIPYKMLNFGGGVNYTAGLPIVRTSPDHGTAFDIAGKFIADESSILKAFHYAEKIFTSRSKSAE